MKVLQAKISLVLLFVIVLNSCTYYKKVTVDKPDQIQISRTNGDTVYFIASVPVYNASKKSFQLVKSHFNLLADNAPIGEAYQVSPVDIEKNINRNYDIEFKAFLLEDADLMSLGMKSLMGKTPELLLQGTVTIKSGFIKKDLPVSLSITSEWKKLRKLLKQR
jgi:hypothetical protein